jgi:hypothetical protein
MDIVTYKTAYYSFYLPVACGLHLADMATAEALETAERILVKMGQYFQIQVSFHAPVLHFTLVPPHVQPTLCAARAHR